LLQTSVTSGVGRPPKVLNREDPGKSTEIRASYEEIWEKVCKPTFAKLFYVRSFYKNGTQIK